MAGAGPVWFSVVHVRPGGNLVDGYGCFFSAGSSTASANSCRRSVPKKTKEGALSGLLSALLGSFAFALIVEKSTLQLVLLGFVYQVRAR